MPMKFTWCWGSKGTVEATNSGCVHVRLDASGRKAHLMVAHPNQCRRLVAKRTSRRVFIPERQLAPVLVSDSGEGTVDVSNRAIWEDDIEFVEVVRPRATGK
jgi:hypothetical protein